MALYPEKTAFPHRDVDSHQGSFVLYLSATVAQSVEQWTENPCVKSSILFGGSHRVALWAAHYNAKGR